MENIQTTDVNTNATVLQTNVLQTNIENKIETKSELTEEEIQQKLADLIPLLDPNIQYEHYKEQLGLKTRNKQFNNISNFAGSFFTLCFVSTCASIVLFPNVNKVADLLIEPTGIAKLNVATAFNTKVNASSNVSSNYITGNNKYLNFPTIPQTPTTSPFGWRTHPITGDRRFHAGLDLGAPHGSPIYAAEAGIVTTAGSKGGYGEAVVIEHNKELSTLYGHTSKLYVREGQKVVRGQLIAEVGSTGASTGPHLHFEVHKKNNKGELEVTDPLPYLNITNNK
jgi:murein DD-endopeptidase MepM/ murein hydrolase activator NlpD